MLAFDFDFTILCKATGIITDVKTQQEKFNMEMETLKHMVRKNHPIG